MILKINNKKFDFFNKVNINMKYDAISSTFGFKALFDSQDEAHKSLFRPLRFSKVEIEHDGELLITGRKLSTSFMSTAAPKTATISGYSLTGVLEDCTVPLSSYPLQADGLSLKQIAEQALAPFDIAVVVDAAVQSKADEVFVSSDAKASGSVKDYLNKLASQKGIILTHTRRGALLLTEVKANRLPVADLSDAFEKTINVNGQRLHSTVSVIKEANITGGNAGEEELDNPIIHSFRPSVTVQTSGTDNDTKNAAQIKMAAELASIKLTVKLDSWKIGNKVAAPNIVISIQDDDLWLYKKTNWFVESVSLTGDEKKQVATLQCVLPEVYTLQTPRNPF